MKNKDKNTPPPLRDVLNIPKNTYFLPSQSPVEEIITYINHVTLKFTVTQTVKCVSAKRRGIVLKYEEGKVHILDMVYILVEIYVISFGD